MRTPCHTALLFTGKELALTAKPDELSTAAGGYELAVGGSQPSQGKLLGSRELRQYYRQQHRPQDERASVQANAVVARCVSHLSKGESWHAVAYKPEPEHLRK